MKEHLLTCEGCQDRLRETDDYLLAVRMASEQCRRDERSAKGREWRFPAWFPALAAEPAARGGHAPFRPAARAGGGGGFSHRAPEHWSRRKQRPGRPETHASSGSDRPGGGRFASSGNRGPDGSRGVAGCVSRGRKSGSRSRGSAQAVLCPRVSAGGRTASRIRFGNPLARISHTASARAVDEAAEGDFRGGASQGSSNHGQVYRVLGVRHARADTAGGVFGRCSFASRRGSAAPFLRKSISTST